MCGPNVTDSSRAIALLIEPKRGDHVGREQEGLVMKKFALVGLVLAALGGVRVGG